MSDYQLQHADIPQITLLDEEVVSRDHDWPMPAVRAWEPQPKVTPWQALMNRWERLL